MKIPPDVDVNSALNLLRWTPRGVLNEKVVNNVVAFVRDEEARSDANRLHFIDTTKLMAVDLNFHYVFHVALYRRMSCKGRTPIKAAFLVKDPAFEHYFKLHALLTDRSPLQVRLFKEQEAAAQWLDVPLESLAA